MSSADRPSAACPSGFAEARIAALLIDPGDADAGAHVLTCPACAERYFDHVVIRGAVRAIVAEDPAAPSVRPAGRVRKPRFGKVPMAAAILIGLVGLAAAAGVLLRWSVIVGSGGGGPGSLSELALRRGLDLAGAKLPPDATVEKLTSFIDADGGMGTALVASIDSTARLDVAAFRQSGPALWTARESWPDWPDLLGRPGTYLRRLETIVSRMDGSRPEDRTCVVLERLRLGCMLIVDPITGELAGRYFHPGPLATGIEQGGAVHVLPDCPEPRRWILLSGQHLHDTERVACLSIVDGRGKRMQHVELPSLGASPAGGPQVMQIRVDWNVGHLGAMVQTTDGLVINFDVRSGKLVLDSALVTFADTAGGMFDAARGRKGAFESWLKERGDRKAAGSELAKQVRETGFEEITSWGVR